ncbi:glycosyltransferase family 4 protein [Castellaniella denitrificans]|uniref:Glycosyltransferase family 4 protein n=1 Tax=Castellaniella denitrificans TaxID=56119 RepID=A0ABT4LZS7_9BURK|nr:glycosyltransferase family 4 protein [Castellaniella denitrificans]MCZ4328557.1 glycosyltransferase family 4 protein [Castellaniella denitrificans]
MERRYVRLAEALHQQGVSVTVLCTHDALLGMRDLNIFFPLQSVKVVDFKWRSMPAVFRKINRVWGVSRALFLMRSAQYKQVHIISNPGVIVYLYAALGKFLPLFSFSVVDSRLGFNPNWVRRAVKAACSVDCLSDSIGEEIRGACKNEVDRGKVHVSPCSFTDFSGVKLRESRDIDVVMMARFSPEKGYSLFLEAVTKLPDGLEMHLCGFGANPPSTERARVYECQNPFEVLARSKIFLSLQDKENYPSQALLEAMASGCAVIATDVGETRRLLDESCAILIRPDADDLVLSIKYLLENPIESRRLGLAARARVLNSHTLERFSEYFKKEILHDGGCASADK